VTPATRGGTRRRLALVLGILCAASLVLVSARPSGAQAKPGAPPASLPEGYAGGETCKKCHAKFFERFEATRMGRLFLKHPRNTVERLGCETCHGPGKAHADSNGDTAGAMITFAKNDPTPVAQRNQACLACHTTGAHLFWRGSAHESRDLACTSCHKVMTAVSGRAQLAKATEIETCGACHIQKRAQQMRSSHMPLREGKVTCSSCHSPHGTVTQTLLKEPSVNDTCYACHAEKRGPFLWEHAPVVESCTTCHDSHGSNREKMLKVSVPRLCQQCHVETSHPTEPRGRDVLTGTRGRYVLGRSCVNCHANIHGSNHPSGSAFKR